MASIILRVSRPFRDTGSRQRFTAQQLADLTGPMTYEMLLAFWLFLSHHAAPGVTIVVPPGAAYLRRSVAS